MADAPTADGFWTKYVTGRDAVFGRLKQDGAESTFKQNFKLEGQKAMVFGRVVGTGVGLTMAAHAFKGVDANGEERSALVRLGEFVLGTGLAAASLLGGKGR